MSELPTELDLLSREHIGEQFAAMSTQGHISAATAPMQAEIVEAAFTALSSPVPVQQECGCCVRLLGPFNPEVSVRDRAQLAVTTFAQRYELLFALGDPQETYDYIRTSGYIQALTAVGGLAAVIEEQGRMMREDRKSFLTGGKTQSEDTQLAA